MGFFLFIKTIFIIIVRINNTMKKPGVFGKV